MENELNNQATIEDEAPAPTPEKGRSPKREFIAHLREHSSDMALVFTLGASGESSDQQFCDELADEVEADTKGEHYQKLTVDEETYATVLKAWLDLYGSEEGCDRHSMEVWRQGPKVKSGDKSGRYIAFWPAHLVDKAPSDQTGYFRTLSSRLIEALREDGAVVHYEMPSSKSEMFEITINGDKRGFVSAPDVNDLSDFFYQLHEIAIDWAASRRELPPQTIKQLRMVDDKDSTKSDRQYFDAVLAKRLSA